MKEGVHPIAVRFCTINLECGECGAPAIVIALMLDEKLRLKAGSMCKPCADIRHAECIVNMVHIGNGMLVVQEAADQWDDLITTPKGLPS